jgi:hypothetical protein
VAMMPSKRALPLRRGRGTSSTVVVVVLVAEVGGVSAAR